MPNYMPALRHTNNQIVTIIQTVCQAFLDDGGEMVIGILAQWNMCNFMTVKLTEQTDSPAGQNKDPVKIQSRYWPMNCNTPVLGVGKEAKLLKSTASHCVWNFVVHVTQVHQTRLG